MYSTIGKHGENLEFGFTESYRHSVCVIQPHGHTRHVLSAVPSAISTA